MSVTPPPAVAMSGVAFSDGGQSILRDVTFEIPQGAYTGIIGPNGGGKTTLLKLMLGIIHPTAGSVKMFGADPSDPIARRKIGYVPQRLHAGDRSFPATVEEVVAGGRSPRMRLFGRRTSRDKAAIERAIETMQLSELRTRTLGELSGGESQKVFIARALAAEPDMLILDEPTTGIDLPSREQFASFLAQLHTVHKLTVLIVSHDVEAMQHGVQSVLCVDGTVLDHCDASCFVHEDSFKKLYGEKAVLFAHHHHH